jgi:hypothetical protein
MCLAACYQTVLAPNAGGRWKLFKGQPRKTYRLYSDGSGATLDATFGAGGLRGKATFIRAIAFGHGRDRVVALLQKQQGGKWLLTGVHNIQLYMVHASKTVCCFLLMPAQNLLSGCPFSPCTVVVNNKQLRAFDTAKLSHGTTVQASLG